MKTRFSYLIEITSLLVKLALVVHVHNYIIITVKLSSSRHTTLIRSASYILINTNKILIKSIFVVHNYVIIIVKTVGSTTHTHTILIISASYIIVPLLSNEYNYRSNAEST
jgi:hypothetical protein